MRFRRQIPDGSELSSLDDWIVMCCPHDSSPIAIRQAIRDSSLKAGQLMVFVQPGLGAERSSWTGVVVESQNAYPLDEIHLIGPRMPVFRRFSEEEGSIPNRDDRWSRQSGALGEVVFNRFRQLSVTLIGAGRLGSLIAEGLVRSGLHRLTIVDPDVLESHNLNATVGSCISDIGRPKVESILDYLHRVQPEALLRGIQRSADHPDAFEMARSADILVSCVDNDQSRRQASSIARRLLKVHLDLGTIIRRPDEANATSRQIGSSDPDALDYAREIGADIRLLLPGSCVDCVNAESIADGKADGGPSWQLGGRTGSLISINYLAVGCGMQMLFDLLAGSLQGSFWQRLRWQQGVGIESLAGNVRPTIECKNCRPQETTGKQTERRKG